MNYFDQQTKVVCFTATALDFAQVTHDGLLFLLVFPVSSEGSSGLNSSTGKNPESASRDTKIGLRTKYPRHYVL